MNMEFYNKIGYSVGKYDTAVFKSRYSILRIRKEYKLWTHINNKTRDYSLCHTFSVSLKHKPG